MRFDTFSGVTINLIGGIFCLVTASFFSWRAWKVASGWAAVARGSVHVVLLIGFGVALAVGMVSGWIGRRRPPDPD